MLWNVIDRFCVLWIFRVLVYMSQSITAIRLTPSNLMFGSIQAGSSAWFFPPPPPCISYYISCCRCGIIFGPHFRLHIFVCIWYIVLSFGISNKCSNTRGIYVNIYICKCLSLYDINKEIDVQFCMNTFDHMISFFSMRMNTISSLQYIWVIVLLSHS